MLRSKIALSILSCTAVTFGSLSLLPQLVRADSLPGYTLFGGVDAADRLNFKLDSGRRNFSDNYYLRLPGEKIHKLGVAQFQITYPGYYNGKFDENKIQINSNGKSVPIKSAKWDEKNRTIQIDLEQRLRTKGEIEVVLNNVQNPNSGGMYHFNLLTKTSPEFPIARYVGTWTLSID
jgi:hypothetical protein